MVQALDAIGYSVDPREEGFLEGGYTVGLMSAEPQAVRIEVHPDLCRRTRYDIDVGSLFERSVPLGDSPAGRRMCDVDSLLYAAVHHALHGYRIQLLWLLDFALLAHVCGQDDAVRERAGQWGARTAMATSRRLAEALFGPLPLPPSRWSAGGYLEALVSADHLRMNRFDDDRRARISSAVALLDRGRAAYLFDSLLRRITKK